MSVSDGSDNSEMSRIYKVRTKDSSAVHSFVTPNYGMFPVDVSGPELNAFLSNYCYKTFYIPLPVLLRMRLNLCRINLFPLLSHVPLHLQELGKQLLSTVNN
jgi:hypothetical protein